MLRSGNFVFERPFLQPYEVFWLVFWGGTIGAWGWEGPPWGFPTSPRPSCHSPRRVSMEIWEMGGLKSPVSLAEDVSFVLDPLSVSCGF